MTKVYHTTKVPDEVLHWFQLNFPNCTYDFYTYYLPDKTKIYGCHVYKDGKFWHNATQARQEWFKENLFKVYEQVSQATQ